MSVLGGVVSGAEGGVGHATAPGGHAVDDGDDVLVIGDVHGEGAELLEVAHLIEATGGGIGGIAVVLPGGGGAFAEVFGLGLRGWEVTDCEVTLSLVGFHPPVGTAGDLRRLVPLVLMGAPLEPGR